MDAVLGELTRVGARLHVAPDSTSQDFVQYLKEGQDEEVMEECDASGKSRSQDPNEMQSRQIRLSGSFGEWAESHSHS